MGVLDVLKKGAGTVLNPFGRNKNPMEVGNANDKNLDAFLHTDYGQFKDAQGNFTPSSIIGTNMDGGQPPVTTSSLPPAPAVPLPTIAPPLPPPALPGIATPNKPTASPIAPPSAFSPSMMPGMYNDGAGGQTYSKDQAENNQYGYWGKDAFNPNVSPFDKMFGGGSSPKQNPFQAMYDMSAF